MRPQPRPFLPLAILALGAVALGCRPSTGLEPMDEATEATVVEDAAITSSSGVELMAHGDRWTGDAVVEQFTTPVYVRIRNDSDRNLLIRYPSFALLGALDRYAVLPPFVLATTDDHTELAAGYTPVESPLFTTDGFKVAPYYAPAYPNLVGYDGVMVVDLDYHTRYMAEWGDVATLPTADIMAWALPEGVLSPGAELTGFLFFEKVDPSEAQINLYFELEDATDHDLFGGLWIPFEPDGPFEP